MQLFIDDDDWPRQINTYSDPNGQGSFMTEAYSSSESQPLAEEFFPDVNNNDLVSKSVDIGINKSASKSKSSITSLERMQPQASNTVMQCLSDEEVDKRQRSFEWGQPLDIFANAGPESKPT